MVRDKYKSMMIESADQLRSITADVSAAASLREGSSAAVWDLIGARGDDELYHLARCELIAEIVPLLADEDQHSLAAIVGLCREKAIEASGRIGRLDARIGMSRAVESRRIHALYRALNEISKIARDEFNALRLAGVA